VVTSADPRKLSLWAEREIGWVLENRWNQLCRTSAGQAPEVDWVGVQREVEVGLQRRLRRELQVEPLIICLVQPAPGGTPAYKGRADAEPESRPVSRGRGGRGGDRPERVERSAERGAAAPQPQRQLAAVGAAAPVPVASKAVAATIAAPQPEPEAEPAGRTRRRRSAAS
jgi:ribonuclease J